MRHLQDFQLFRLLRRVARLHLPELAMQLLGEVKVSHQGQLLLTECAARLISAPGQPLHPILGSSSNNRSRLDLLKPLSAAS